ncbi:MAG TPA: pyridine nucleotide-disulfide oxidoreductase, partial [Terrimesophilobacter sp.]|nr:pyridine nucleotide-disulfide oxidoreductase [Terrimesophilobacter sp.]
TVVGARNARSFGSAPDIAAWASEVALNPARIPPEYSGSADLDDALDRLQTHSRPGLARLAVLSGIEPS